MSGKLILLDAATLEHVPTVLRSIADEIEAGTYGKVCAGVVVLEGDEFTLFGAGDAAQYKAMWMLEAAKMELLP
jgi:hypothetical protein